ncbi:MAG: 5-formyltetrahydrofolate cyclo-ligase [Candidatus Wenzhouxiangella sp. M2_3B_020]
MPESDLKFGSKNAAREHVWQSLKDEKVAAFPFPPDGRIPNFRGAADAAKRLLAHSCFDGARRIKCNPDAPQRPLRERALRAGIELVIPTPRLKGGFRLLDPEKIPDDDIGDAVTLAGADEWGREIPVKELPEFDLVVAGSVAVTRAGKRCGKGHGYSDLEYAILRELGHPPVDVVTTVHPLQMVDDFPADAHDLPVRVVVTPDEAIEVSDPPPAPSGIDWDALSDEDLEEMPVLTELKRG